MDSLAKPVQITLSRSRLALYWQLAVHLLVICSILLLRLPLFPAIALVVVVVFHSALSFHRWQRPPEMQTLQWRDRCWGLQGKTGEPVAMELTGFHSLAGVLLLYFRFESGEKTTIVLFPDSTEAGGRRQLRQILQFQSG